MGQAQPPLLTELSIPIRGYDLREKGFPFGVSPGEEDRFLFLQYWPADKTHLAENIYLQCLTMDYELDWHQPVTDLGMEGMSVLGIERLDKGVFVTGYQYIPKLKQYHTVGRFFDFKGHPKQKEPQVISTYHPKAKKGYEDRFIHAPERRAMLWMGSNHKRHFFSAWAGSGDKIWGKELHIPHTDKAYQLADVAVTDDGMAHFLLSSRNPRYSLKDTALPPLILSYDHRVDKFKTDTVLLDSTWAVELFLTALSNKNLLVCGILGAPEDSALSNGHRVGKTRHWGAFFSQQISLDEESSDGPLSRFSIPESWKKAYAEKGCTYTDFQLLYDKQHNHRYAVLLMEEAFEGEGKIFNYDMAVIGIDTRSGQTKWATRVEKQQRGYADRIGFSSHVAAYAKDKVHLIYLSEMGAPGKLMCSSIELRNGKKTDHRLASNETTQYLFFPTASGIVGASEMILIGMGDPAKNDFKFLKISF